MKILLTIFLILSSYISFAEDKIDIIIIKKSERKLYAIKDDKILKKYDIALGQNPVGHKKVEGDKKTPEGYYFIDGKNAKIKLIDGVKKYIPSENSFNINGTINVFLI